jgi:hypothetical protein
LLLSSVATLIELVSTVKSMSGTSAAIYQAVELASSKMRSFGEMRLIASRAIRFFSSAFVISRTA